MVSEDWAQDDLVLRAVAALHGDVTLYATVETGPEGTCQLDLAPHTPGCAHRLVILRGTSVFVDGRPYALTRITGDGTDISRLPHSDRIARLSQAADPASPCATAHATSAAGLDPLLTRAAARAVRLAVPPIAASLPHQAQEGDVLGISTALNSLRDLQHQADHLYGRLEPERALSWFLEELGELAQAMRRAEPSIRLEEELGQVAAWCLCMANIARIDLGGSLSRAMHEEHGRQLRKYGALRPYVPHEEAS
ncbi:MazG nucleotide pyrophosphohydrolase domain-containing protein [Streptomyces sp. MI02-7b]|uniref:MazG nucleotide pyrophosphohydrolase domain-containing protein n=1 Tax=Streptomyces sp. MI02-7b TaxID=462941 RepID=UPI0029AA701F|nr:MazG nucleotide pyrophosphohydrolase domain-containing protein [Streptomyces sp. MI02-7b]MDX3075925.1 MazG nucleotide pyrophosphohydrolase domain-containing protein [Streptomyces sp. MI02-7b]